MSTPINKDISVSQIPKRTQDPANSARNADIRSAERGDATTQDQVTLTEPAQQIRAIREAAFESPEVDEARVRSVQAAIEDGSYKIDSSRIAERLLEFEAQLQAQ